MKKLEKYPKVLVADQRFNIVDTLVKELIRRRIDAIALTHEELLSTFLSDPQKYAGIIFSPKWVIPKAFNEDERRESGKGEFTWHVIIDIIVIIAAIVFPK